MTHHVPPIQTPEVQFMGKLIVAVPVSILTPSLAIIDLVKIPFDFLTHMTFYTPKLDTAPLIELNYRMSAYTFEPIHKAAIVLRQIHDIAYKDIP